MLVAYENLISFTPMEHRVAVSLCRSFYLCLLNCHSCSYMLALHPIAGNSCIFVPCFCIDSPTLDCSCPQDHASAFLFKTLNVQGPILNRVKTNRGGERKIWVQREENTLKIVCV